MSEDRFFSRRNLVAAGWSIVLAICAYVAGRIEGKFRGPDEVIVTKAPPPPAAPPTVVHATAQLDLETVAHLREVARHLKFIHEQEAAQAEDVSEAEKAASAEKLRTLERKLVQLETDALIERMKRASDRPGESRQAASSSSAFAIRQHATLVYPRLTAGEYPSFSLPPSARGYWPAGSPKLLRGLACPKETAITPKSGLRLSFTVADPKTPERISPLFLTLIHNEDGSRRVQHYGAYIPVASGANVIELATDLDPGRYEMTAGYYLLNRLSGEFPTLHAINCTLTVQEPATA